ncbi:MAG: TSUP family transporter, partial [Candidatus Brocadiae bacterium]|nr:TSUP family transporter [Candidatus Brocadiia bacterium]
HYLDKHDGRNLAILVPGLAAGIGLGYFALDWFLALPNSELWMKRLIGFLSVTFVSLQFYRMAQERQLGVPTEPYRPRAWHGVGLGACAGLTSTLAHAGGPLISLFLLPQKLPKQLFVGTVIKYFFIGNLIKLIPYFGKGLMTGQNALLSLLLVPSVVLGTLLGVYLHGKFSDRAFRFVVYCLAFCIGVYFLSGWQPGAAAESTARQGTAPGLPDRARAYYRAGLEAHASGDYDAAAGAFQAAVALAGPWQGGARFNLGLALYEAGRYDEADGAFAALDGSEEALAGLRAAFNRGNASYRSGRFARAAEWYLLTIRGCRDELADPVAEPEEPARGLLTEVLGRAQFNLALAGVRSVRAASPGQRPGAGAGAPQP